MNIKVTMNLTRKDVKNTESLQDFMNARSKAQAVSTALSVTKALAENMKPGSELLIRQKDGSLEKIIIPELS